MPPEGLPASLCRGAAPPRGVGQHKDVAPRWGHTRCTQTGTPRMTCPDFLRSAPRFLSRAAGGPRLPRRLHGPAEAESRHRASCGAREGSGSAPARACGRRTYGARAKSRSGYVHVRHEQFRWPQVTRVAAGVPVTAWPLVPSLLSYGSRRNHVCRSQPPHPPVQTAAASNDMDGPGALRAGWPRHGVALRACPAVTPMPHVWSGNTGMDPRPASAATPQGTGSSPRPSARCPDTTRATSLPRTVLTATGCRLMVNCSSRT